MYNLGAIMFFSKQYNIDLIDSDIEDEFLTDMASIFHLPTDMNNLTNKWYVFGMNYGLENGLDTITANSFAFILTKIYTDMSINAGTDDYFDENRIMNFIYDMYHEYDTGKPEEENAKLLFFDVFDIYDSRIEKYSKKTERLQMRVSYNMLQKFMSVDGDHKVDKLQTLLECYDKNYKN